MGSCGPFIAVFHDERAAYIPFWETPIPSRNLAAKSHSLRTHSLFRPPAGPMITIREHRPPAFCLADVSGLITDRITSGTGVSLHPMKEPQRNGKLEKS